MGATAERAKTGFSETRTTVLGAHLLLGFQYQALFQPGFLKLPEWARASAPVGYALLTLSIACMIAPTAFHRIGERGDVTLRLNRLMDVLVLFSLWPFALAMGGELAATAAAPLGPVVASICGLAAAAGALIVWFVPPLIQRPTQDRARREPPEEDMPLKDRIKELIEESRIVLPGVQALLGFQFAAYLTEGYGKLPGLSQAAHTMALVLLLVSMVLLMAPTPFHRIACGGEPSERADKVGTGFVLWALAPLGLALGLDFYVILEKVSGSQFTGALGALGAIAGCLILWLAVPMVARLRPAPRGGRSQRVNA